MGESPPTLRLVRTEDLDATTRAAVIDVCLEAHGVQDFVNLFTNIPDGGRHVLATDDGRLVGHAVATTRWVQPAGHPPLRTAYVDAVSVLPSQQGRGVGSAVMRHLVADAIAEGFVIGCLETDRQHFYERLGWEVWRGPLAGRRGDELVPTPDQTGIMVLALAGAPPLDLDAALTVECQPYRIW
jgi:aminoglycoside 2'-N-acetyltransferase I